MCRDKKERPHACDNHHLNVSVPGVHSNFIFVLFFVPSAATNSVFGVVLARQPLQAFPREGPFISGISPSDGDRVSRATLVLGLRVLKLQSFCRVRRALISFASRYVRDENAPWLCINLGSGCHPSSLPVGRFKSARLRLLRSFLTYYGKCDAEIAARGIFFFRA